MVRLVPIAPSIVVATSIVSFVLFLEAAREARADTLADAVALAYQTNPTLQSARAQLRAINESFVQARAGYRPQIGLSAEGDYADGPSTYNIGLADTAEDITATQPLYTGGLVSAQVRAAMADILASRQKLRQTEADVLQAVIQSYVDVRRDQQALSIAGQNVDVLTHQLDETNARFEAGDVTRTDIALAQARLAAARAQLATAQAQLSVSRSNYAAVVGQSPGQLEPEPALSGVPATIDQALDAASNNSPLILSADYAEQAAAARVAEAKAANRPTVSLRAQVGDNNYYMPDAFLNIRNGVFERNITASIVLNQPLFAGGANASRVREAADLDNAQLIGVESAQRDEVRAVSQAWAQLSAARANVSAEAEQVRATQVAYEGTHEEHQVGLRTTIDVLNAEQELRNAQLALIGAQHDEYVASASLLNAMGLLRADALSPGISLYRPEAAFDKVKRDGAVPWEGLVAGVDSIGAPPVQLHPPAQLVAPDATPAGKTGSGAQVVPQPAELRGLLSPDAAP